MRFLTLTVAAFSVSGSVFAQFTGPAPLVWRWQQSATIAPLGVPAVDGENVFVAVGQHVYSLDKATGNTNWRYPAGEGIEGNFKSEPLLTNGIVIATADNKTVYAADEQTGQAKWQYSSPVAVIGQPVVAGKFLILALSDNTIMAVDTTTGSPAWASAMKVFDGIAGALGAHEDKFIYMTTTGDMYAMSAVNNLKPIWHAKFTQVGPDAKPVVFGDTVLVTSGPYLASLSAVSGTARWQVDVGEEIAYSPAVSAAGVMVVTREGHAFSFTTEGRKVGKGMIDLKSLPAAAPAPAGNLYVVPTTNGSLNLIDPKTGGLLWNYIIRPIGQSAAAPAAPTNGGRFGGAGGTTTQTASKVISIPAASSPVLVGQTLLVMARDASLLAFDKDLGVDLTPPDVKMVWPHPGDQVSGQPPLDIIFRIQDEASGVNESTIKLDVDGAAMDYEFSREGYLLARISALSKNLPLRDGRRVFHVTVADWMGNQSTSSFSITVDNTLKPLGRPGADAPGLGSGSNGGKFGGGGAGGGAGGGLGGGL